MSVAVITGASSGMGREFALQFAQQKKQISTYILVARRKKRLEALQKILEADNKQVILINEDITGDTGIEMLNKQLSEISQKVEVLVNAAGFGMMGQFQNISMHDQSDMILLNCVALTKVIHTVLPYMAKNAKIINIASSAAFLPQKEFAVYAASKSYVLSLSKALHLELKREAITVTAVCPGPVDTEFFDRAEKYQKMKPYKRHFLAPCRKVVQQAIRDSYKGKTMSVYGFSMRCLYLAAKILPERILFLFEM